MLVAVGRQRLVAVDSCTINPQALAFVLLMFSLGVGALRHMRRHGVLFDDTDKGKGFNVPSLIALLKKPYQIRRFISLAKESYEPFPTGLENTKLFVHMSRVTGDVDTDFLSMLGAVDPN